MFLITRIFGALKVRSWRSNKRFWLIGLSFLILVFGAVLTAAALYLAVKTATEGLNNGSGSSTSTDGTAYNTWIALMVTGGFQVIVATIGIVAADKVSIYGLVLYFWLMALVLGAQFLFAVTALNFQYTFQTWIKHHWTDGELEPARKNFCFETWNTLCNAPLSGYPYDSQTAWCVATFDQTTCEQIQETAIGDANAFVKYWMNVAGGLALSSVFEMLACLYLIMRLVTIPVLMRSMQSIINYFLVFPIVGSIVMGWALSRFKALYQGVNDTMTILLYLTGVLLIFCAVIGVIAGHVRHRKLLYVHVGFLTLTLSCYVVLIAMMFYLYGSLKFQDYSQQQTWDLACELQMYGCCCCMTSNTTLYTHPACPEWTIHEMQDNGGAVLKVGTLTVILDSVFVVCSLLASLILLHNLKGYECEYI